MLSWLLSWRAAQTHRRPEAEWLNKLPERTNINRSIKSLSRGRILLAAAIKAINESNSNESSTLAEPSWLGGDAKDLEPSRIHQLAERTFVSGLPDLLARQMNSCRMAAPTLCGFFPSIHHAWATVKDKFYVWNIQRGGCHEFCNPQVTDDITAVAMVQPATQLTSPPVKNIIAIATQSKVFFLGLYFPGSFTVAPFEEGRIHPMPQSEVKTPQGVTFLAMAATDSGRIFLGGSDGHLYELQYHLAEKHEWMKIVCRSSFIFSLQRLAVTLGLAAMDPVVDITIDSERHILYAKSSSSRIAVFDLGSSGSKCHKVADAFVTTAAAPGRRPAKRPIVAMEATSAAESSSNHLQVTLEDGRRVLLSTEAGNGQQSAKRPKCLKQIAESDPPPKTDTSVPSSGPGLVRGVPELDASLSRGLPEIVAEISRCCSGILAISRRSSHHRFDLTVAMASSAATAEQIVFQIEGLPLAIAEVLPCSSTTAGMEQQVPRRGDFGGRGQESRARRIWARGEFATQHFLYRRQILAFSSKGIVGISVNRPVDRLAGLLAANASLSRIQRLFLGYGRQEAAAMCLQLAAGVPDGSHSHVREKAEQLFENANVMGAPRNGPLTALSGDLYSPSEQVTAVQLCMARLLLPVWSLPLVTTGKDLNPKAWLKEGRSLVSCRYVGSFLRKVEHNVRLLESFLAERRSRQRGQFIGVPATVDIEEFAKRCFEESWANRPSPASAARPSLIDARTLLSEPDASLYEMVDMESMRTLLKRSAEVLNLLVLVDIVGVSSLAEWMEDKSTSAFRESTFEQVVCTAEGQQLAEKLVDALLQALSKNAEQSKDLLPILQRGSPSFLREQEKRVSAALATLNPRPLPPSPKTDVALLVDSVFDSVSDGVTADTLLEFCEAFKNVGSIKATVALCAVAARNAEVEASNQALSAGTRQLAVERRESCYDLAVEFILSLRAEKRSDLVDKFVDLVVKSADGRFRERVYSAMARCGMSEELLKVPSGSVEEFLCREGGFVSRESIEQPVPATVTEEQFTLLTWLSQLYTRRRLFLKNVGVLVHLAEASVDLSQPFRISLTKREQCFKEALVQLAAYGGSTAQLSIGYLEHQLRLVGFQKKILARAEQFATTLESKERMSAMAPILTSLQGNLQPISILHNTYAFPMRMWTVCLEMLESSNYGGVYDDSIRQLKDLLRVGGLEGRGGECHDGAHVEGEGEGEVIDVDS